MFRLFNAYSSYLSPGDYLEFSTRSSLMKGATSYSWVFKLKTNNQINIQLSKRILARLSVIHVTISCSN